MKFKAPEKPWDVLIAQFFIKKIAKIYFITPNHITLLRLLFAISSIILLANSNFFAGSILFTIANFLDHVDGELARFTKTSSRFGHWLDLATDAFTIIGVFLAIGFGLAKINSAWFLVCGIVSAISVCIIFLIRNKIEQSFGKKETKQKSFYGFESEDILYLLPLLAITDTLIYFLILSSCGAPIGALLTFVEYKKRWK